MKPRSLSQHDPRAFPILYVDDESANLRTFELTFRREFTILTAQSAEEGMAVLNEHPVAVVLSDHKMPGMTGVEFMRWVRDFDEHTVRILVTAYGDVETLGAAINDGRIYRYVPKPWNPDELGPILRRAIERFALDRDRRALLDDLTRLGELSQALRAESSPEAVLACAARAAHQDFGCDGAAALVLGSGGERLDWAAIEPRDAVAGAVGAQPLMREGAPFFFEALEAGSVQVLRADGVMELERPVRDWLNQVSADELVVVPLSGEGRVLGALAIDNRSGGRHFGADDRTLLDSLAVQTAQAFEHARARVALGAKQAQEQRADASALVGQLWGGVAREISEALGPVGALLQELPNLPLLPGARVASLAWEDAQAGLERARWQIEALERLGGAPGAGSAAVPIALEAVAGEVVALLETEARHRGVELDFALEAEAAAGKVLGDPGALQQAIAGLILRALDASACGARVGVLVRTGGEGAEETRVVEVSDCGGIAVEEQLPLEFGSRPGAEPAQRGSVPAMASLSRTIREQGGSLSERPLPGGGRCCELRLPCEDSGTVDAPR